MFVPQIHLISLQNSIVYNFNLDNYIEKICCYFLNIKTDLYNAQLYNDLNNAWIE